MAEISELTDGTPSTSIIPSSRPGNQTVQESEETWQALRESGMDPMGESDPTPAEPPPAEEPPPVTVEAPPQAPETPEAPPATEPPVTQPAEVQATPAEPTPAEPQVPEGGYIVTMDDGRKETVTKEELENTLRVGIDPKAERAKAVAIVRQNAVSMGMIEAERDGFKERMEAAEKQITSFNHQQNKPFLPIAPVAPDPNIAMSDPEKYDELWASYETRQTQYNADHRTKSEELIAWQMQNQSQAAQVTKGETADHSENGQTWSDQAQDETSAWIESHSDITPEVTARMEELLDGVWWREKIGIKVAENGGQVPTAKLIVPGLLTELRRDVEQELGTIAATQPSASKSGSQAVAVELARAGKAASPAQGATAAPVNESMSIDTVLAGPEDDRMTNLVILRDAFAAQSPKDRMAADAEFTAMVNAAFKHQLA